MQINIKATNIELTEQIKDLVNNKIGELSKLLPDQTGVVEAWVEVGRTSFHHQNGDIFRAEVNIRVPGKVIRAEAERQDLDMAINEVRDELHLEIKKYKDMQISQRRKGERLWKKMKNYSPLAWGKERLFGKK